MKKAALIFIAFVLCSAAIYTRLPDAEAKSPALPKVRAEAASLIDVASGRILWSLKGDKPMRIASLTKVMTAIIAIENGKLSDRVVVGKNAYRKEGSSIYLTLGEEMSLQNMLYGLMLRSGNDAATAIAEHVGGSVEGFVFMMNEKAEQLGMNQSHFMNPTGLDEEGHYASANDMAKLTAYALQNPVFRDIVKTKVKQVPNPNENWEYTWRNKNKMLSFYEGADGVKTGFTKKARRTLITSATRDGQQLAAVTLNDGSDWADHTIMLNYGFGTYDLRELAAKGQPVEGQPYVAGKTLMYPLSSEEETRVTTQVELNGSNSVKYRLGERGKLHFLLEGKEIAAVPLYDRDSPLLHVQDSNMFKYTATENGSVGAGSSGWEIVGSLIRGLLALRVKT